ncbi:type II toxin-antitoxin system prevent-host-death family antitoxin [bacterium]|nr:type II toxin-antitoxin system prevent-host-death family antitoxin [bacterium]
MKTVGAFEAKTKLSELLRAVEEQHEEIIIQKHNRNIARLIPFEDRLQKEFTHVSILDGFRNIRGKQKESSSDEINEMISEGRKR